MRYGFIAALAAFAVILAPAAKAEDAPKDVKGLFLMSDYPAVTVRPGETSTINLRLQNYDMAPERLALSVSGVPTGWTATLMGGGQPVAAAMPATNSSVSLELRLDVPKNAPSARKRSPSPPRAARPKLELPIAVTLAKDLPAKLTLTPQLPELRGTSKSSFEYQLSIKNDSGKKLTVSLAAQAPQNFDAIVHRAIRQPGAQRGADRCRPDQGREAQGDAAEYGRSRRLQGHGAGGRRGRLGDDRSRPRHHRPAEARCQRPRGPGLDARCGRQGDHRPDRHHQYRHRAGRRDRALAARRRADGRSPSIRRRSTASRRTRTRKCRR